MAVADNIVEQMKIYNTKYISIFLGAIAGSAILHPLTMVIYWLEFHAIETKSGLLNEFMMRRIVDSFSIKMLPMSLIFALFGAALGYVIFTVNRSISHKNRKINYLTNLVNRDLVDLIGRGESENLEFKSSLRWNNFTNKVDRDLELTIVKTIGGLMNSHVGTLIIGIDDKGNFIGLLDDYSTLKRKNRDGFEQHLMNLISTMIGTDLCPQVHVLFHNYRGIDICRIIVRMVNRNIFSCGPAILPAN